MNDNRGSLPYVGAFVLGSVVGALAGALVGVLVAPKAGTETQADIKRRMEELREQADEAFAKGRESLETSIAGTGGRIVDTARSKIAEQMEGAASSISQQAKHIRPDNKSVAG